MDWSEALQTCFPEALTGTSVTREVNQMLEEEKFDPARTLFGTSTCPDELNRTVTGFESRWGPGFHLGGLAGLPFTGESGFQAFSSHIPDGGGAFIVYASHVGVAPDGDVGRTTREGQAQVTLSCGSAMGAYLHLQEGGKPEELDGQQQYVTELVERHLAEIENSDRPMAALPTVVYERIDEEIEQLIPADFDRRLALLGGIQINTPQPGEDYFLVKKFSVLLPVNNYRVSLLERVQS